MVELSKDHHAGLLFSWKIKEGLKRNVATYRLKKYVNYFWENHLKQHFQEEEALLFNRIDDVLSQQGKTEHLMLASRVKRLNYYENENKEEYLLLAELLIKHIRFEERTLFPFLEKSLPLSALINVKAYLSEQHQVPFKDNFPDEFWTELK